jgi:hypothetical protein
MTGIQKHQIANRIRRIPRRIHELLTLTRAAQARIDHLENDESITDENRKLFIRNLREEVGPANAQIRTLVERGLHLGIAPRLLNP